MLLSEFILEWTFSLCCLDLAASAAYGNRDQPLVDPSIWLAEIADKRTIGLVAAPQSSSVPLGDERTNFPQVRRLMMPMCETRVRTADWMKCCAQLSAKTNWKAFRKEAACNPNNALIWACNRRHPRTCSQFLTANYAYRNLRKSTNGISSLWFLSDSKRILHS